MKETKGLFFSPMLSEKRASHKITYIALMTALLVAVNALESASPNSQFSITMFLSVFAGVFLGGVAGFASCFLGDMIGFFLHPKGEYSPWIGIATGLMALFAALCVYLIATKNQKWIYVKLSVACLLIFVFCTCGITTLYLRSVRYPAMPYFEYLALRLFGGLQLVNSLVNSALIIFVIPKLAKIKQLGIKL